MNISDTTISFDRTPPIPITNVGTEVNDERLLFVSNDNWVTQFSQDAQPRSLSPYGSPLDLLGDPYGLNRNRSLTPDSEDGVSEAEYDSRMRARWAAEAAQGQPPIARPQPPAPPPPSPNNTPDVVEHPLIPEGLRSGLSLASAGKRVRASKQFLFTIHVPPTYILLRTDIIDLFYPDIAFYCVAFEKSNLITVSKHMHAYLEFKEDFLLSDLRQVLLEFFDGETRFDLQKVRSRRNVLKYITKEDKEPLYNVKLSDLHFYAQAYHWAKNTPVFKVSDPFVACRPNQYRYLSAFHSEVQRDLVGTVGPMTRIEKGYMGWHLEMCEWWNGVALQPFVHKRKSLFIYGASNVGKSCAVEKMIGKWNMPFVFYPDVGKFMMTGFRKDFHKFIIFEEFDCKFYPQSMIKRLLEGSNYSYSVKGETALTFSFKGPIIFVSNYYPDWDQALKSRVLFISAQEPYWVQEKVSVPKTEAENPSTQESNQEIWDVSSGSEDF